uniref:HDC02097 n=1 Tax=Drosophila melanogaster TaxID=7227 RepID=Q6IHN4_DROME|nr:TPA_inf: HDC02097 [Drosophila melanogaster]
MCISATPWPFGDGVPIEVAGIIFRPLSLSEAISLAPSDFGNLLMCSAFCTFLIFCSVDFDMLHETFGSACIHPPPPNSTVPPRGSASARSPIKMWKTITTCQCLWRTP